MTGSPVTKIAGSFTRQQQTVITTGIHVTRQRLSIENRLNHRQTIHPLQWNFRDKSRCRPSAIRFAWRKGDFASRRINRNIRQPPERVHTENHRLRAPPETMCDIHHLRIRSNQRENPPQFQRIHFHALRHADKIIHRPANATTLHRLRTGHRRHAHRMRQRVTE